MRSARQCRDCFPSRGHRLSPNRRQLFRFATTWWAGSAPSAFLKPCDGVQPREGAIVSSSPCTETCCVCSRWAYSTRRMRGKPPALRRNTLTWRRISLPRTRLSVAIKVSPNRCKCHEHPGPSGQFLYRAVLRNHNGWNRKESYGTAKEPEVNWRKHVATEDRDCRRGVW